MPGEGAHKERRGPSLLRLLLASFKNNPLWKRQFFVGSSLNQRWMSWFLLVGSSKIAHAHGAHVFLATDPWTRVRNTVLYSGFIVYMSTLYRCCQNVSYCYSFVCLAACDKKKRAKHLLVQYSSTNLSIDWAYLNRPTTYLTTVTVVYGVQVKSSTTQFFD